MAAALKVGVAGLGTVGAALVAQVTRQREALAARCGRAIEITAVCARTRGKDRGVDLRKLKWFSDPVALAREPGIDVFVELVGGAGDPAKSAVEAALAAGKSVVTANKALLARHGGKLAALAESKHVALNFEAAVGGAIPIVKTLREGMAGNSFERIYGILNGTCNYILTRMEQDKMAFAECLKEAQRLGYAEVDPSFDIEGHDTAQKLAILASLAFGTKVDQSAIYVEGISSITPADLAAADELGYRVKLLGVAVKTPKGIEQRVHPTMVRKDSAIAQVMGVTNAVTIDAVDINPLTCGRSWRRRRGDRIRRTFRHRRYCARRAHRAIRTAYRAAYKRAQSTHAASRGWLLHTPGRAGQAGNGGDDCDAPGGAGDFA